MFDLINLVSALIHLHRPHPIMAPLLPVSLFHAKGGIEIGRPRGA
jgi:hypothetical protein